MERGKVRNKKKEDHSSKNPSKGINPSTQCWYTKLPGASCTKITKLTYSKNVNLYLRGANGCKQCSYGMHAESRVKKLSRKYRS